MMILLILNMHFAGNRLNVVESDMNLTVSLTPGMSFPPFPSPFPPSPESWCILLYASLVPRPVGESGHETNCMHGSYTILSPLKYNDCYIA